MRRSAERWCLATWWPAQRRTNVATVVRHRLIDRNPTRGRAPFIHKNFKGNDMAYLNAERLGSATAWAASAAQLRRRRNTGAPLAADRWPAS